jgi:hypothetical protein
MGETTKFDSILVMNSGVILSGTIHRQRFGSGTLKPRLVKTVRDSHIQIGQKKRFC